MAASTAITTVGTTLTVNDDPDGVGSAVAIANVVSLSPTGTDRAEIDITHLGSSAKEYLLGLIDYGQFGIVCDFDADDAGQVDLRGLAGGNTAGEFIITLSDNTTITFRARVRGEDISIDNEASVRSTFNTRVTGARAIVAG